MKKNQGFRKLHRYKRKKPIFRNRFFRLGILAFVIIISFFYFLFFSEFFQVERIIISGQEKVSENDLRVLVEKKLENKILFSKTKSIFLINLNEIKEDILNDFPQIAEVKISRRFFDALNVVVTERLALAAWCREVQCFQIDNEGVIFEEVLMETGLIRIVDEQYLDSFVLGEKVMEKEKLIQIFEIDSKLRENLKLSITEAFIISDERLNVKMAEGWYVYFNLKGDLDWQITELGLVLVKQIPSEKRGNLEYIDLRFGNRVYYK